MDMKPIDRRTFLGTAAGAGLALACRTPLTAQTSTQTAAQIEILPAEVIGTIAPELHGQFIETLDGVIYDGVWVGEHSKIPNIGGMRTAFVDALKRLQPALIRWPGGCFADSYDWRDGIGNPRPQRSAFWGKEDPNQFGTHEFMKLCRMVGAQPYLTANVRSGTARDFYQWIEYCNAPAGSTTLARQREANGDRDPFNVKYWGLGNESWGCGGNLEPEEYAALYRRFTAWVPRYNQDLKLIAVGPSADGSVPVAAADWTRRVMKSLSRTIPEGLSVHFYTSGGGAGDEGFARGDALKFDVLDWYAVLERASRVGTALESVWTYASESDPQRHCRLVIDEWGVWYGGASKVDPAYILSQTPTLRDALLTGITLDIFHRNADKVTAACASQAINCVHSLALAHGSDFTLTPIFHVFEMYGEHRGGQAVRAEFLAEPIHSKGLQSPLAGLSGSASIKGKQLFLTVVNPHADRSIDAAIAVRGASVASGSGTVLTNADLHAHNDFAHTNLVQPAAVKVTLSGGRLAHEFPAASVTALKLQLV